MADQRRKDINWTIRANADGSVAHEDAQLAVLMDIRDAVKDNTRELQKLNTLLHCGHFIGMPHVLKRIDKRLSQKIKLKGAR